MNAMRAFLFAALLLIPAGARASAPQGAAAGFGVANGGAIYSVTPDPGATSGRVVVRRLGLEGAVLWQERFGSGRNESAVGAAVTAWGGLSLVGDDDGGCFAAHWSGRSNLLWSDDLRYGSECHARAVLVDGDGNTYALATTVSGGVSDATLWKIDRRGEVAWTYRPTGPNARYAFALALSAAEDAVTVTTAASGPSGWVYASFDVDSAGRSR
jgi:hypothetical protein